MVRPSMKSRLALIRSLLLLPLLAPLLPLPGALVEGVSLGLSKLVVEVVAAQEATVAMFASLGFEAEALLEAHVRDNTGELNDLFVMAHFVDDTWSAMETTGIADLVERGG